MACPLLSKRFEVAYGEDTPPLFLRSSTTFGYNSGGLTGEQCTAFLKIGRVLGDYPKTQEALENGTLSWRKAAILVGELEKGNETDLLDAAQGMSAAELKFPRTKPPTCAGKMHEAPIHPSTPTQETGNQSPRVDPPDSPPMMSPDQSKSEFQGQAGPDPGWKSRQKPSDFQSWQYLTLKFTPEQYSQWAALSVQMPGLSKEEQVLSALEQGAASTATRGPAFLIVLKECPECGRARFSNARGTFEASPALLEKAHCDAVIENKDLRRKRVIPPRLRRQVLKRDGYRCQGPKCENTNYLQLHHRLPVAKGGETKLENLITLCRRCHTSIHEEEEALRVLNQAPNR